MRVTPTSIPEVLVVEPDVFRDERGFFLETCHTEKYRAAGIGGPFVQDNHSLSARGTLRGLHSQRVRAQGKLVRCIEGRVVDVAVDVRRGSPSFKRWVSCELSEHNFRQLWIPAGFLHGFVTLSERAQIEYKCTDLYDAANELGVIWDDPDLAIRWPLEQPILSDKDRALPRLADVLEQLPLYRG